MSWIHDDSALLAVIVSFLVAWLARGWVDRGLR